MVYGMVGKCAIAAYSGSLPRYLEVFGCHHLITHGADKLKGVSIGKEDEHLYTLTNARLENESLEGEIRVYTHESDDTPDWYDEQCEKFPRFPSI
jgi:hypothetical protein